MSDQYYDDDGAPIHRLRITEHMNQEMKQSSCNTLELYAEVGKGPVDNTDPTVTLRYSNNGGYTWSHHLARSLGQIGEYDTRVTWNRLGAGKQWTFEFKIVASAPVALIDLFAEMDGDNSV